MRFNNSQGGLTSSYMQSFSSKGIVKDYSSASMISKSGSNQPYDYQIFLDMVRNDPVLSRAIDIIVEFISKAGWTFVGKDSKKAILKFKDMGFDCVKDNMFYTLLIHGDLYLETKKKELNVLETTEMSLRYDKHGKILGLVQNGTNNDLIKWGPKDFIHIPLKSVGSRVYSYAPLEPIAMDYSTNIRTRNYIDQVFQNMPPRLFWVLKNASDVQRERFVENLRISKQYGTDVIASGEAEVMNNLYKIDEGLIEVMRYVRNVLLTYFGIPSNWLPVSTSGGANRGDAENNLLPFGAKVKRLTRLVEDSINRVLKDRYGLDAELKFLNLFVSDDERVLKNADMLLSLGYDKKVVNDYVLGNGVNIDPTAKIVNEQVKNMENSPSRERMDKQGPMKKELGETGVSEKGKEKMEEQVGTRSSKEFWQISPPEVL